jgi:nicotinic acetylcholine receptor
MLYNNADAVSLNLISTHMIVQYDGNVTWLSIGIFSSSCSINVRYFPFHTQVILIIFTLNFV